MNQKQTYIDNPNYDNQNYQTDLSASTVLLKYLDKYPKPTHNIIYNERQLEINNYYIMKYKSESYILRLIILFCGLALIGCLFFFKGFISETLYITYLGIIISVGIITILYNVYDLLYRDNRRFDEYDYGYMSLIGTDMSSPQTKDNSTNNDSDKIKCV
jgi:uncharacterized membrane protein